jgi:ribosomal protein S18 acetylase RimI-like enzyme
MSPLVRPLLESDASALTEFFVDISSDAETTAFFHPHAFDRATAERICGGVRDSRDEYYAALESGLVLGYAMLRGWDEGYDTPSFGVCVRPTRRGERISSQLLDFAIERAVARGASRMMLKVSPDNEVAVALYRSRGFEFTAHEAEQLVGYKALSGDPEVPVAGQP